MFRFLLALTFVFSFFQIAPANAQYNTCYVNLVDNYTHQMVRRFQAVRDYQTGRCREGLHQCMRYKRERGLDQNRYVCREVNSYPNPQPNPNPGYGRNYYLSLNDQQLVSAALNHQVGMCLLSQAYNGHCQFYMKVNGRGYPDARGTGCTNRQFTAQFGCNFVNEVTNAACLMRLGLRQGHCGI